MKVNIDHYLCDKHDEPIRFWTMRGASYFALSHIIPWEERYELIKQPFDWQHLKRWTVRLRMD